MNRLAQETSPYLRQHRSNPVDWYPWGEEAFAAARERDVPVLLSVGYSACHWCHVMAHESFEDEATAAVMNELFVNVKVDREERPDVDAIYMDAVQAFSGRGGWPMTVFLTPDGEPFVGGTYFPREQFLDLMRRITEAWTTRRSDVVQQGRDLTAALDRGDRLQPTSHLPGYDVLERAFATLNRQFDAEWGGFGAAPKFPSTMALEFLLRWHLRTSSSTAVEMVATSLDAMVAGGMYDHFGGGFARYSTDRQWVVPHFEKMLYDQALLVGVYLHAWQVTGVASYRLAVEATVSYVLRQLCHRDGGFFSAEDADSEGVEGKFYVWTPDEVRAVLGPDAGAATEWWQMSEAGNFEGSNIPVRLRCPDPLVHPDEIDQLRHQLFEAREQRIRPGLDDKVLTEWNGLMLSALAQAAAAMGRHDWLQAAVRNGEFLLASLRRPDGRWLRSWQDGEARHLAYAADHAALVDAFTRLAEATGETRWIDAAVSTADAMLDLFWDEATGGLFTTGRDAERLITRLKDVLDNATPAANSVAAVALARLAALTGEDGYRRRAEDIVRLLGEQLTAHPSAFAHLLTAVELLGGGLTEVAVVGDRPDLVAEVHGRYLPATVLAWGEPRPGPMWDGRSAGHAYVCRGQTCLPPVTTPDELAASLGGIRRQ